MNYHKAKRFGLQSKRRKKKHSLIPVERQITKRDNLGIKSDWNTRGTAGSKMVQTPLKYGKISGVSEGYEVSCQSEISKKIDPCNCTLCSEGYKDYRPVKLWWRTDNPQPDIIKHVPDLGVNDEITVTLVDDIMYLEIPTYHRGYNDRPEYNKGIVKLLRQLQADTKGPWTYKPFLFNNKIYYPSKTSKSIGSIADYQCKRADRVKGITVKILDKTPDPYDKGMDVESRMQMNAGFEQFISNR